MKKISIFIILFLIGCSDKKDNNVIYNETKHSVKPSEEVTKEDIIKDIDYDLKDEFIGSNGLYKFEVPKGLFDKISENEFRSDFLQANIRFTSYQTYRFDDTGIFSKNDLIKIYKNRFNTTYFVDKNDWFVLSGTDNYNNIIYIKGIYEELVSMQGRDEGEPSWIWSKSGVLEIEYTEDNKAEFDKLIPFIMKSFKCDFSKI
jgi:hypothetical protein